MSGSAGIQLLELCLGNWLSLYGVHVEFIGSLYGVYGETRFLDFSEKSHDSDDSKYTVYN